ncbi:cupin domain-containing protein [Nocardia sp. CNY236]|uniref:cupin domain-containing protein n=1 Tax=Nocardia sp. CNY236 TaxID=1169152 RepID=UPI0004052C49|nr:cupin domain-containing protein [Nocardia sp. CNY236]
MTVIRHSDARRTETPGGVMTTLASPSQGGAGFALWRVEVPTGTTGPLHYIDAEQIWTVIAGRFGVTLDATELIVDVGDTVIFPAHALRQVRTNEGYTAIVTAPAGARAGTPGSGHTQLLPWGA